MCAESHADVTLCIHCRPLIAIVGLLHRPAKGAESHVAVALCTYSRPIILAK